MQARELRDLYTQLIDQNVRALVGLSFEIAYHALATAMHCAGELHDAGLLSEVGRLAGEQGRWIDANAPGHNLSSRNAKTRGNQSVFVSPGKQAESMVVGLKVGAQAETVKRLANDGHPGGVGQA